MQRNPTDRTRTRPRIARLLATAVLLAGAVAADGAVLPPPPAPEPVAISELPLPPTAPFDAPGTCTAALNPRGTGCIATGGLQSGSFLPGGREIVAVVTFAGAPAAPARGSAFAGRQTILIKTDGTRFANGDAWKCVTCGVPAQNARDLNADRSYPQAFADGRRLLIGSNIVTCGRYRLAEAGCTPDRVRIYPIRLDDKADGTGRGAAIRELRLHPDQTHLGFNMMTFDNGILEQYGYTGRLVFDPAPRTGTSRAPRYDLVQVNRLFRPGFDQRVLGVDPAHPDRLRINEQGIEVGEFRGFTKDGREAFYIGYPFESSNIDVFAVDLVSGRVRRVTANPEYTDPLDSSPDDRWVVVDDTRGSDRQMFVAAMRGVPPLTDLVTSGAVSSIRNNRQRRFFQPILIDRAGDRGAYQGQQLNAGDGVPGSASDPNWNAMADPRWSPDGTAVVYWQAQVESPSCGGTNPLPCPAPTEPGGRRTRIMIARLTSRHPVSPPAPVTLADTIPWGTAYSPGAPTPRRTLIPAGRYTLAGRRGGSALVTIAHSPDGLAIASVAAVYRHYSDDGTTVLDGSETVVASRPQPQISHLDWQSALIQTGAVRATKRTGPDGFHLTIDLDKNVFEATGTLSTTIDGRTYRQPVNGG